MSNLRENLIALMRQYGDNQYTLCEKSGIAQSTLSRIMTGYHKDPRSHIVKRLAEVYGVTESQLRGESPILHGDNVIMINSKAKKINEVVNKMEAMSEEDIDRFLGVINLFGNNNRDK